ncbi:nucleotidyltransferase domain-containing protein [Asanoa sp. WMMD1127]|uniref:nucleotidyltransferase domain-containing protein n=1 Tax=Asanoa sp. WMMD1127 TaxID=3016107 RepID=UPI0024176A49|nr:nucleotidyltransferase domain-containing protein [Asanoa sp. WMMD1127]MDG4823636.1 nucleotidyltransferase domain-containing protein [Asanoa sp. WMMD1127]
MPDEPNPYLANPRWVVAELVADAARRRYPADILAIGVHGSLAHGDDHDTSDVDLVVVTYRPGAGPRPVTRRVDGVLVDLGVVGAEEYLRHARTLTTSWPLAADRYVTTKPIHDPDAWLDQLRDVHLGRLAEARTAEFTALAREAWCRGASAHARATRLAAFYESDAALVVLAEVRLAAATVIGLLTRTYFRNSADAVHRTGVAGADLAELGVILRDQAQDLADRGRPVDGTVSDLFDR